jgi:hypothetical protein
MLKYFTKFAMEIVPSVIATILGAYIVNHYITAKPAADPAAVTESKKVEVKADARTDIKADPKTDPKSEAKPAEAMTDLTNLPEPGVRAKGISEKAIQAILGKPAESVSEKPAETPAAAPEVRRIPLTREKAVAKAAPVAVPAPAAAASPPVETAAIPEEHRDAAELARAAIERLRANSGGNDVSRAQESARAIEPQRVPEAPRSVVAVPPAIRPLPPPITVAVPGAGTPGAPVPVNPSYTGSVRIDDPLRPTPPADIPTAPPSRPLDLHADGKTVAEDMLSAAKSMFHAVLPK